MELHASVECPVRPGGMPAAGFGQSPNFSSSTLTEKVDYCTFPHPAAVICTVELPCGCVAVVAGGRSASVVLLSPLHLNQVPGATEAQPLPSISSQVDWTTHDGTTIIVSSGLITCLAAVLLPGGTAALCVAGTSGGSLCLFVLKGRSPDGTLGVYKICETSLCEFVDGLISARDIILDVSIGLDPAGRLEFIAATTSSVVVMIDARHFDDSLRSSGDAVVQSAAKPVFHHNNAATVLPLNETFYASFTTAEVVRILAPQRYRSSFSIDVALLIVFDNGELRYVLRRVIGGSLQLLQEHHQQRQARHSEVGLGMLHHDGEVSCYASINPLSLPHVLYAYSLSEVEINVGSIAVGTGMAGCVVINDAALYFDPTAHNMSLVVAGAEASAPDRREHGCGKGSWWGIVHPVVKSRGTFELFGEHIRAWAFAGPKSGMLPRGQRGLAALVVAADGKLLFTCGKELHVCSVMEAMRATEVDAGGAHGTLRRVYGCGSVVTGVCCTETRFAGKVMALVTSGTSLSVLLL
uniref:Uncharacterized protein n=1 Tax=Trypanosoma vivax (strain Y486) TaxID=1055687 RepID=G0U8J5_TRYVY|nr:conserved hypothetical protein [Trypanosoma vivax Y486]